ncbi:GNAT family N-acetyltransferase [Peribacillus acanthi]|uniref:GNAT family N-acetyltransferase n=1 Tax=Peribacillus acanthi TaxID=2171554 RepID=UPI000D3E8DCE|nr:GNAT family protein [Peribacillus acanthi]
MKTLETERLLLRPLTTIDSERVEELASDYDVAKTTLTIPYPYPKGSAMHFITSVLEMEKDGKLAIFAIVDKGTNDLIGIINMNLSLVYQRGELAYWVGKSYWGQGYGTEAAKVVMKYGFEELGLNKVFAQSFTNNPGSWKIMEKIGLKYEGTLKQHVVRFGEFHDLAHYGLLKEEYLQEAAETVSSD